VQGAELRFERERSNWTRPSGPVLVPVQLHSWRSGSPFGNYWTRTTVVFRPKVRHTSCRSRELGKTIIHPHPCSCIPIAHPAMSQYCRFWIALKQDPSPWSSRMPANGSFRQIIAFPYYIVCLFFPLAQHAHWECVQLFMLQCTSEAEMITTITEAFWWVAMWAIKCGRRDVLYLKNYRDSNYT
jgi:hypothetical protein